MAKTVKPAPVQVIIPAYAPFAGAIVDAFGQAESIQVSIGAAVQAAGRKVKEKDIEVFVGMVRHGLVAAGLVPASIKVECSRIRRVLLAMAGGYKPAKGLTLRAMYEGAPKDPSKGGAPTGPRHSTKPAVELADSEPGEDDTAPSDRPAPSISRQAAIVALFGHFDDELDAAVAYAVTAEMAFTRWAKASAQAAMVQQIEAAALAKPATKPATARKASKASKASKAA